MAVYREKELFGWRPATCRFSLKPGEEISSEKFFLGFYDSL